jgi:hypothetical protein
VVGRMGQAVGVREVRVGAGGKSVYSGVVGEREVGVIVVV